MKRFTETDKWMSKRFRTLTPHEKLVQLFLNESCNNAGFIEIDLQMWSFQIGLSGEEIRGAIKGLMRGLLGANGWLWNPEFLKEQKNLPLNFSNNAHKKIISLLRDQEERFGKEEVFKEILGAVEGLISPIGNSNSNSKGNSKGSSKGKIKAKHLFRNSPYHKKDKLMEALKNSKHPNADVNHYHQIMLDWSDSKNEMRADWAAVCRTFITKDKEQGKFVINKPKKGFQGFQSTIN